LIFVKVLLLLFFQEKKRSLRRSLKVLILAFSKSGTRLLFQSRRPEIAGLGYKADTSWIMKNAADKEDRIGKNSEKVNNKKRIHSNADYANTLCYGQRDFNLFHT
jgi:hypothetical protein